jgi:hypothetical protein
MPKNLSVAIFAITTFMKLLHVSYAQAEESPLNKRLSLDMLKTCKLSTALCKIEDLLPEHLDILNWHLSEDMLKTCKLSKVLCKIEDLIPEHLEELGLTE